MDGKTQQVDIGDLPVAEETLGCQILLVGDGHVILPESSIRLRGTSNDLGFDHKLWRLEDMAFDGTLVDGSPHCGDVLVGKALG